MSPREKRWIAFISVVVLIVAVLCLAVHLIPNFLYAVLIFGVACIACFYYTGDFPLHARLGPHPRSRLVIPPVFRRWFPERTVNGVPIPGRIYRDRLNKGNQRDFAISSGERRFWSPGVVRKESEELCDSLPFSPRDILMGSYLGKPDSPPAAARRPSAGGARELRDRLSRPNHAVHSDNRRLSFGDPVSTAGRFTITPQRHYPLQQTGSPTFGVMPLAQWEGYRKKNVLTPRNSHAFHSPVTVKIARPDHNLTRSPIFNNLNSSLTSQSLGVGHTADPCSRESVLSVLKESRKREVDEDEDRGYPAGQNSKRRRHDSSGSGHSAFESLLANGAPSQLVPRTGNLKRGFNPSVVDDSLMKRSRTSSASSQSCVLTPGGVLGSARNPIQSSYSSSQSYNQRKMASTLSSLSPLSSPGSSRSHTPERAFKKPRAEETCSHNSVSSSRSEKTPADHSPALGNVTPALKAPIGVTLSNSAESGGKRKRKIQLVSSRRGDQISLPPPPELGYTVTVKDLDSEKKAAFSQIKKVFEEPEALNPVPVPAPAPAVPTFTQSEPSVAASTSASQLPGSTAPLMTAPALASSAAQAPGPSSEPPLTGVFSSTSAGPDASVANPLLESLRIMKSSPAPSPAITSSTVPVVSVAMTSSSALTLLPTSSGAVKSESSTTPAQAVPTSGAPLTQPPSQLVSSAFAQVLAQPIQAPSGTPALLGSITLGIAAPVPTASSASTPIASTGATSSSGIPLASAFKPIFGSATTAAVPSSASNLAIPTFKPIFGAPGPAAAFGQLASAAPTATTGATPSSGSSSVFGGLTSASTAPAPQTAIKSLFNCWNAASGPSAATPPAGLQFTGALASTTAPSLASTTTTSTAFQYGSMTAATTAPQSVAQAAAQATFAFGPSSSSQTATTGSFTRVGGVTTTAAPTPATAGQTAFTFGKPSFDGPAPFPSGATPAAVKPFNFGVGGATPFGFGAETSTVTPPSRVPSQSAFGAGTLSGFDFRSTTAPSAAPAFGSSTQTPAPAPTFTFGGASSTQPSTPTPLRSAPAQQSTGGFHFAASMTGTQFGTPTPANPTPQTPGFSFGGNNAKDNKPAFGTSTPAFGTAGGPIPFGSPGTPNPGFSGLSSSPFGASFSIGSGSKPSAARQRLQARRQHPRKK